VRAFWLLESKPVCSGVEGFPALAFGATEDRPSREMNPIAHFALGVCASCDYVNSDIYCPL
jgi:hypothetical protein